MVCVCVFLVLAVLAVFGQTAGFGFVNYDDNLYVFENPKLATGLSLDGIVRAFTHVECSLYHPLTMISLRLDYQLHGLQAGGYHLTNVLIHTASVILLFLILRQMTGALWRSAFVAAVFAIHPLRVESVAWVAERKDVLAAFFFMLTVGAYVRYVQSPHSRARYLLVAVFFVLSLLCKPTAVTLPFVLLLLDYWPLGRMKGMQKEESGKQRDLGVPFLSLVKEKIPLMALAAAACVVTCLAARKEVMNATHISMPVRLENGFISYVVYLRQMVWPGGLAAFYPCPDESPPLWEIGLAFILLAVISGGVLAYGRKRPWLLTGWFWYLGMLVPLIGIVSVGDFAHADRNTYLPQIGLYVLLTWMAAEGCMKWKQRRLVLGGLMMTVVGALMFCAHAQTLCWMDSESLWTRALACTSGNYLAHNNLGNALYRDGRRDEAIAEYRKALDIKPDYAEALNNLGVVLFAKGDLEAAIAQYRKALDIKPDYAEAIHNLGSALATKGDYGAAIEQYRKALEIKPDYAEARNNLGNALLLNGDLEEAIAQYRNTLKINPRSADAYGQLGQAFLQKGQTQEAIKAWQESLEIKPEQVNVQKNLAWVLATTPDASLRNGAKALALAEKASQSSGGGNPMILRILAAAYAETGNYGQAADTARRALELAAAQKNDALAAALQKEVRLYETKTPVRDAAR